MENKCFQRKWFKAKKTEALDQIPRIKVGEK